MASVAQWVEGARPRTLPNAVAPVLAGTGAAAAAPADLPWSRAGLALLVALALVIGVNYANDYSDGVRGADAQRVGPMRLVGSGAAAAGAVRTAALVCLGVAAAAGLALVTLTGQWWLLAVGAACIAGAWYYTGGASPYGYAGLGELAVFVFFGPVAVLGTQFVLSGRISGIGATVAVATGSLSAAVLVANNLRDIPSDTVAGKHTLAVLLGDSRTRVLYVTLLTVPVVTSFLLALATPAALAGLLFVPLGLPAAKRVLHGATGGDLVTVLRDTALAMLLWAAATAIALASS